MSTTRMVPTVTLNDGHEIPQLGFGVFQIPPEETAQAVGRALEAGYRHVDTAEMYGNERGVGEAVRAAGLDRAEVYITSKLNNGFHKPEDARHAFERTLADLAVDYVDLFLIHWPLPTRCRRCRSRRPPPEVRRAPGGGGSSSGRGQRSSTTISEWPVGSRNQNMGGTGSPIRATSASTSTPWAWRWAWVASMSSVVRVIPVSAGVTSVPGRGGASAIPALPSGG